MAPINIEIIEKKNDLSHRYRIIYTQGHKREIHEYGTIEQGTNNFILKENYNPHVSPSKTVCTTNNKKAAENALFHLVIRDITNTLNKDKFDL